MDNFKLSEEEAKELAVLAERFQLLRNAALDVVGKGDEEVREKLKALVLLNKEVNELYERTVIPQMISQAGDDLGRCIGYHLQLLEAILLSMAQLCMNDEEKALLDETMKKEQEEKASGAAPAPEPAPEPAEAN